MIVLPFPIRWYRFVINPSGINSLLFFFLFSPPLCVIFIAFFFTLIIIFVFVVILIFFVSFGGRLRVVVGVLSVGLHAWKQGATDEVSSIW